MTPKILNKIRVPIWSLLLFCPIILIVLIMYGALVRYEVLSEKNRFPVISKTAVFLSELPSNINYFKLSEWKSEIVKVDGGKWWGRNY